VVRILLRRVPIGYTDNSLECVNLSVCAILTITFTMSNLTLTLTPVLMLWINMVTEFGTAVYMFAECFCAVVGTELCY